MNINIKEIMKASRFVTNERMAEDVCRKCLLIFIKTRDANSGDDGWNPTMNRAYDDEFGNDSFRTPAGNPSMYSIIGGDLYDTMIEMVVKSLKEPS